MTAKTSEKITAFFLANWRYFGYMAFLILRIYRWLMDRPFPTDDGVPYYLKSAWMAMDPLRNAMPWNAFAFMPHRPPGPMWLSLPFLSIDVSFAMFFLALIIWSIIFVELGSRALFSREQAFFRNVAALLVLGGNAVFFAGFETYYVDFLFTAITFCAFAMGLGWMREGRLSLAIGCGLSMALALWTKPAGLAVILSVSGGLVAAQFLDFLISRKNQTGFALKKRGVQLALIFALAGIAVATLFFTDYVRAWEDYRPDKQTNWQRQFLEPWYSVDKGMGVAQSLAQVFRNLSELLGPPVLLLLVFGFAWWAHARLNRRSWSSARIPTWLYLAVALFGVFLFTLVLPVKTNRYTAPLAAMVLAAGLYVLSRRKRGCVLIVSAMLAVALLWRILIITNAIPYRAWVVPERRFAFSMVDARENLRRIDRIDVDDKTVDVIAMNPSLETGALFMIKEAREHGLEEAIEELHVSKPVEPHVPMWPEFHLDGMQHFQTADVMIVQGQHPDVYFPQGSRRQDMLQMERDMWDVEKARAAGWELVRETPFKRIYESRRSTDGLSDSTIRLMRGRYMAGADFHSEEGRALKQSFYTMQAYESLQPEGRDLAVSDMFAGSRGIMAHAPYDGNPLPEALVFSVKPGDRFWIEARRDGEGDGIVVVMDRYEEDGWARFADLYVPHKGDLEILIDDHVDPAEPFPDRIRLRFYAGAADNTWNDCAVVAVRPPLTAK